MQLLEKSIAAASQHLPLRWCIRCVEQLGCLRHADAEGHRHSARPESVLLLAAIDERLNLALQATQRLGPRDLR